MISLDRKSVVLGMAVILVVAGVFAKPGFAETGTLQVSGMVSGPPPGSAPTITSPTDAARTAQTTSTVSGGCLAALTVKVFRSHVFAGSAVCQNDNQYSLNIDLVDGRNDVVVRQYDALDQSSPDSDTIIIYSVPPDAAVKLPDGPHPDSNIAHFQLIIDYNYNFMNVEPHKAVHLPIHFSGGAGPYAVSVDWGDSTVNLVSRSTTEQFFADHAYKEPGNYAVHIQISDNLGKTAHLQFAMRVNGAARQIEFLGIPVVQAASALPGFTWPSITFGATMIGVGVALTRFWPAITKVFIRIFLFRGGK
ncbi:MAG TPA: hypothetical protein VM581_02730 [Magnetospirillaceae bacterium]|nr:hypothetical protein [Magnetospirillaceae bacterium]